MGAQAVQKLHCSGARVRRSSLLGRSGLTETSDSLIVSRPNNEGSISCHSLDVEEEQNNLKMLMFSF